jgi:flagellar motor switch protein FliM
MTQARIVLRGAALEEAEELQKFTKLGSVTEVINVMFSRYADHLKQTWVVQPVSPAYAKTEPSPEIEQQAIASPQEVDPDFFFDEPFTGI